MSEAPQKAVRESYDRVAEAYADHFFDELRHKPLDRALLAAFAESIRRGGRVVDVGCGPGQVARALHGHGLAAAGLDLSDAMVALARRLTPAVPFSVGSMLALDLPAGSVAGLTAFYALVHFEKTDVSRALREFQRVLEPGGHALLAFHVAPAVGDARVHRDELLGQPVDLDFIFFERAFVEEELRAAGFTLRASLERAPYEAEHPTQRAYVLAQKPN